MNNIRQQILNYTATGTLKRYDTGIYYIPGKTYFGVDGLPSPDEVIRKKYLTDTKTRYGYISGINFANAVGITTQVPMTYSVVSNKASRENREVSIKSLKILLRKPKVKINSSNYKYLQLLDLIKDVDIISELEGKELKEKIKKYMQVSKIKFSDLEPFLPLYPDKTFRNLYTTGVLSGVST